MNKRIETTDIVAGYGLMSTKNTSNSTTWLDNENIELHKTTTSLCVDMMMVQNTIDMHLGNPTSSVKPILEKTIQDSLLNLLKTKVRFEVISWLDENQLPTFTCMVLFDDKVISEKDIQNGDIRSEGVQAQN